MRTVNINKPLLLADNAPVRCTFYRWDGLPQGMNECETDATFALSDSEWSLVKTWMDDHPNRLISMSIYHPYLCDTHRRMFAEMGIIR